MINGDWERSKLGEFKNVLDYVFWVDVLYYLKIEFI